MWKIFLLTTVFLVSCKASNPQSSNTVFDLESFAKDALGEDISIIDSEKYALVHTFPAIPGDSRRKIVVINKETESVIFGPTSVNGEVSWYSENEILVQLTPGVIQDKSNADRPIEIINVETGKKKTSTLNK